MSRHVLQVEQLSKVYRTFRKPDMRAVEDVSLTVGRSEIVGLLGANGAGKTTTIKCICNLVVPTTGQVAINGMDTRTAGPAIYRHVAAVLEGNRNIYWTLTVRENLEFFAGLQGIPLRRARAHVPELLRRFGLEAKEDAPARMLSRGMQQKLALACALIKGTELLILDEPTLGLDVRMSHDLRASLREMGTSGNRSILLSSHDMNVVQSICDRVVIVNKGRVVADERVGRLLDLFRPRSYRVAVDGALNTETRARVAESFAAPRFEAEGDETRLHVDVPDPARIYDLIDLLRAGGASIRSVDRREPTLEEVFLSITGTDARN